ncbi:HepT-like ribonuclease domain-containing protein [Spirosoma radiotolerans]|uniref:DUF86 domain-containing protein n=1 Tax=Spirosoma radiotolerans TaxID=1379870 RepID=A0A0E3V9R9_9BACT|nr:HepT-like ribonuclease domain-containing protein [Spirosoma radiotolerans]AKD57396.1 hypothetical protein SD10_23380 [Spirosoma radiotolerans]
MPPSPIEFLQHIRDELAYILKYSQGVTYEEFLSHPFLSKAFVRSCKIIGEACKNVPDEIRYNHLEFDWKGFAGMRDKLIHHYWGIDNELMWDAIQQEVSPNKEWIDLIIEQELTKRY